MIYSILPDQQDCNLFIINTDDRFGSKMVCFNIPMRGDSPSLLCPSA